MFLYVLMLLSSHTIFHRALAIDLDLQKAAKVSSGLYGKFFVCARECNKSVVLATAVAMTIVSTTRANARRAGEQQIKRTKYTPTAPNKWCGE